MPTPLAEAFRPASLDQIYGQEHLLGEKGFLTSVIKSGKPLSIILWGPPGCGKTSIARLYAKAFAMKFETLSAVFSGVADIKKVVKEADSSPLFKGTVLFVDEIHRFNKAQQDAFLPFVENGTITLVGATAENPSFYLNQALLSRVRVLVVKPLNSQALNQIIERFEKTNGPLPIDETARQLLMELSQGDGRYLLNLIENLKSVVTQHTLSAQELALLLQQRSPLFDRAGDQHYNLISALHKSIRGSDPDAALYWFCRLVKGGEDPLFLARRLIRVASEDVGLADPQALPLAVAARDTYEMLGSPEGELALAEIVVYLALSPKSNAIYTAYNQAKELAEKTSHLSPPAHILNAPTALMKTLGYSRGYAYDHDLPMGFSGQNYFPEGMAREEFYLPFERGYEREMKKRLDYFKALRENLKKDNSNENV